MIAASAAAVAVVGLAVAVCVASRDRARLLELAEFVARRGLAEEFRRWRESGPVRTAAND